MYDEDCQSPKSPDGLHCPCCETGAPCCWCEEPFDDEEEGMETESSWWG